MYTWVDNITQICTLYSEFILIKSCLKYFDKYLEISYFELKNKQTKNKHNFTDLCTLETKKTSEMTTSGPFSEISVVTYELWQDCSDHNQILQCYSFYRNF